MNNTETTFTATSGHRCMFEVKVEGGRASVNVVWLGNAPTPEDVHELQELLLGLADQAGFQHTGAENVMLGQIQPEDLGRIEEVLEERKNRLESRNDRT